MGYLWQGGKAIFGVEAAFDWTNLRGSRINSQAYFNNPGVYTVNENPRADWLFTFLGRVGYDFGSWYPLFDGGCCRFKPQIRLQLHGPDFRTDVRLRGVIQQTKVGFAGGAGVAWKLSSNWSLRGEYLYIAFDSIGGPSAIIGTPPFDFGAANFFPLGEVHRKHCADCARLSFRRAGGREVLNFPEIENLKPRPMRGFSVC
ncbi:outer membrane protein [Bradyrhizobium sp.]|uniref:outer membrane protein n=1 Tax=Bradyrhizobium sp. TaxID=376 RepID=UPI003BAE656D